MTDVYPLPVILSIGELVVDVTIVPQERLRADDDTPARITIGGGGQAANFCAWAAALGERARLIARLGDDDNGRHLVAEIEAVGVEVCAVWAAEPTGVIAVLVGPDGERSMATQHGAGIGLRSEDLRDEWLHGVGLIHVPAYSLFLDPLRGAARAAIEGVRRSSGGLLSIDLSSVAGIKKYGTRRLASDIASLKPDLLFANEAESAAMKVPLEDLTEVAVLKLGAAGCRVMGHTVPAPPVVEVDATGAGDAFAAAFCLSYLNGATPIDAAQRAVAVASNAVTQYGARPR